MRILFLLGFLSNDEIYVRNIKYCILNEACLKFAVPLVAAYLAPLNIHSDLQSLVPPLSWRRGLNSQDYKTDHQQDAQIKRRNVLTSMDIGWDTNLMHVI